ncbi:MAG: C10 family peptidase [Bacteroidales bacterium]|nr:C10 family peptidase [Bacteroidales bacterium]
MKRILVFSLYFLVFMLAVSAQGLTPEQVRRNAQQFADGIVGKQPAVIKDVALPFGHHIAAYNIEGGGFVIASTDSRTRPVLAYSRTGSIAPADLPEGMRYWLEEYDHQIDQLGSTTLEDLQEAYASEAEEREYDSPDTVAPMLVTEWTQYRYGYNSMAPYDSVMAADSTMARFGGHPTVGCVALAMAQVMRYWQFPSHGVGSHSYTHEGEYECWRYGTLSADFANTTYDYAHMPFKLTDSSTADEVTAVATLASHCGIGCNMKYNSDCQGSSGAQLSAALAGLQHFFHYSPNAHQEMKNYYGNSTWTEMLKHDLANGRPVLYCGHSYRNDADSTVEGGHAFVFDGYDARNYFHVNWGWHGSCDGYYSLDVLRPLTQYNFTSYQYCILGLEPCYDPMPVLTMAGDLVLDTNIIDANGPLRGSYSMTNIGDTVGSLFFGVNIYGRDDHNYYGCVDGRRITLQPGDTVVCHFAYNLHLPEGNYYALMQYSTDTFYAGITVDETFYHADLEYVYQVEFSTVNTLLRGYTNLALFVRFADDPDFTQSYSDIQNLFNEGSQSVADYFSEMSYGNIQFNTVYAHQRQGNRIRPYVDSHPRGYYQPYSEDNPIGYTTPNPVIGISMREAELIERVCRYVDNERLVDYGTILDGNNDGDIDNVSIIIQGDVGGWAELLWPHMEFFPHDSIGSTLTINDKRVNAFNFEFEGSSYFTLRTFAHEMGHSLGLPDLYHYHNYTQVYPVFYDMMAIGNDHPSAIYKHRYLGITDTPTQITQEGTYTINSLTTSATNNLYYIKSAIDSNQWYTIEYRTPDQHYEVSLTQNGLIIGRWMDTATHNIYLGGNAFFDYPNTPNVYWVFRPDSDSDTLQGDVANCHFTQEMGREAFGPSTNPHPYLADGTPEQSFEIYDIHTQGSICTFSVRFLHEAIANSPTQAVASAFPNPTSGKVYLRGIAEGTPVNLYNAYGALVLSTTWGGNAINLSHLSAGLYMLATPTYTTKIIVN